MAGRPKSPPLAPTLAVALVCALAGGRQALAFGDCADPAWRAAIDPRLADSAYDCVEALRLPVATADGERWIRVVHDREAGWILTSDLLAEVERGVRGAAAALPRLGSFRMDDVTLLLADDLPPGIGLDGRAPAEGEIGAQTSFARDGECLIGLYLLGAAARSEYTATSVAHEMFHCVQAATIGSARLATSAGGTGNGGDWWIEGSAEWFTALALPDAGPLPSRAAAFDEASPSTPLNAMAYGAAIFFLWLGVADGPAAILPFLGNMATTAGAAAQWQAMTAALPAERWLNFAEAYRDGEIRHPHGTPLGLAPREGDSHPIERSQTLRLVATPFVLLRGTLEIVCGRWQPEARPLEVQVSQRDTEGGAWSPLAAELVVPEGETQRLAFVAINPQPGRRPLLLRFERLATCHPCAGSRETDACLVGSWQQSGGGAVEWLRANLPPGVTIPMAEQSQPLLVLRADGSYLALPLTTETLILAEQADGVARAEGNGMAVGAGTWSAVEGTLNICQDSGGLLGSMTVTFPGSGSVTQPVAVPGAATLVTAYSCAGGGFTTSLDFGGGLPPMETQYRRVGE